MKATFIFKETKIEICWAKLQLVLFKLSLSHRQVARLPNISRFHDASPVGMIRCPSQETKVERFEITLDRLCEARIGVVDGISLQGGGQYRCS